MNVYVRRLNCTILYTCKRLLSVEHQATKEWIEPFGYQTNLKIYNSATKSLTPLILRNKDVVKWYTCGPTVYNSAHIGHAVTYVRTDIIRRILTGFFNIDVVLAMCITDVDDKIIQRSKLEGIPIENLTKHYADEFFCDMEKLNVLPPTAVYWVSNHIPNIVKFIEEILNKDDAYIGKDGSIYFDTLKYMEEREIPENIEIVKNPNKRSDVDFALWKIAKPDEPFWESPWGKGRPGWHIECSTLASKIFGNSIDIHSGGADLIFPHHKNEEVQSCCYHGIDQWVNYWMHFGHLYLKDDVKMSKSLNNTISIQEFLKDFTGNEFRMLCLLTNYRNGIEFSTEILDKAKMTMHTIQHFLRACDSYIHGTHKCQINATDVFQRLHETKYNVTEALATDFNTAVAMRAIVDLIKYVNIMLHTDIVEESQSEEPNDYSAIGAVATYISSTIWKFGISKSKQMDEYKMNRIITEIVQFRRNVRLKVLDLNKDGLAVKELLKDCDNIRTSLSHYGIMVHDQKGNTSWTYKQY